MFPCPESLPTAIVLDWVPLSTNDRLSNTLGEFFALLFHLTQEIACRLAANPAQSSRAGSVAMLLCVENILLSEDPSSHYQQFTHVVHASRYKSSICPDICWESNVVLHK